MINGNALSPPLYFVAAIPAHAETAVGGRSAHSEATNDVDGGEEVGGHPGSARWRSRRRDGHHRG